MTTPTQAQIEAAAEVLYNEQGGPNWFASSEKMQMSFRRVAKAALTAAAQVGEGQLPDGMEHCVIQFKECEKGHGRLTATNWIDHGCDHCKIEQIEAATIERCAQVVANYAVKEELEPMFSGLAAALRKLKDEAHDR